MQLSTQIENSNKNVEINDFKNFIERQNNIEIYMQNCKFRRQNHIKLLDKVIKLKSILEIHFGKEIDPIKYLKELYYEENLSINSIINKLKDIYNNTGETKYFYKISDSLQAFFKGVLNWELKDPKIAKTTKTYKIREKPVELVRKNQEEKDKRVALFFSWFIKNSTINNFNFDIKKFNEFKFKYEKFIYLLQTFLHINSQAFHGLKKINLGNQSFADRFNEIFKENNIDFEISHKDIARIFEKY